MEERIVRTERRDPASVDRSTLTEGARRILESIEGAGVKTLPHLFLWRTRLVPDAEALRHKLAGHWRSITYRTWETTVRNLAAAMAEWTQVGDRVAIMSENRPEWTYADLATQCLGGVVAPIYPTDLPKDAAYVINDAKAHTLFVSTAAQLAKTRPLLEQGQVPGLQRIIVFDRGTPTDDRVLVLDDVVARGRGLSQATVDARLGGLDPDAVMTFVYTSGTTGERKGVMLTHTNFIDNIDNTVQAIGEGHFHDSVMLSFLPLSHSLERMAGYYTALRVGAVIAYAESIEKLPENLLEVRPTILVSVPRVYEKVYARVQSAAASSPVKKRLLAWARAVGQEHATREIEGRERGLRLRLQYALADRLVFSKLKARLGGRLRFACTGGAPMPREIAIFLRGAGLLVLEGYGMTETAPVLTLNGPEKVKFGSVGRPIPGVELKIVPEPGCERPGEGEILARGTNVMKGYHDKVPETKAVLEPDGWLHTGDIGYFDEEGYLFITDRKKELLKTSGGKYVAPSPIEGRLNVHPLIEQSCVIGNQRKYCVALIVPKFDVLPKWLNRPLSADRNQLVSDPEVRALFEDAINAVNQDLSHWEQIRRFALLPHEFSQETGELTPTQKMKRRVIDEKHKGLIDTLFPPD
ncbi:MAG: long-chain fatty acid--CoA ligase [Deltaproteobacteria bacterium]|nr:long-chain fatty acid--CoA ligase [Deltaproteobacteria bacterium]